MAAIPDCIGRSQAEAQQLLRAAGLSFTEEITRPTRDFFKTDSTCLYVVRQRLLAGDEVRLTLAARMEKEVSCHGL
ncbi:MAG: PASTA domain-containing protein [Selenomonas sp.]|jgi:hypothetical protein|nr:PASTA domain-containing protein [Selenomonas sp.]MCI7330294.1 PASTA domain-containing protein [Selenomonadaceae bacterium]MDY3915133.1 PASTA domain-containing protein [Selenomonadaceae bacterium]HBT78846.1 RNA-3-phosphate cyclase [Selenomonas sp.]